jgi:hypothetical protein
MDTLVMDQAVVSEAEKRAELLDQMDVQTDIKLGTPKTVTKVTEVKTEVKPKAKAKKPSLWKEMLQVNREMKQEFYKPSKLINVVLKSPEHEAIRDKVEMLADKYRKESGIILPPLKGIINFKFIMQNCPERFLKQPKTGVKVWNLGVIGYALDSYVKKEIAKTKELKARAK